MQQQGIEAEEKVEKEKQNKNKAIKISKKLKVLSINYNKV